MQKTIEAMLKFVESIYQDYAEIGISPDRIQGEDKLVCLSLLVSVGILTNDAEMVHKLLDSYKLSTRFKFCLN